MSPFVIFSVLLLALAGVFFVPPLWRGAAAVPLSAASSASDLSVASVTVLPPAARKPQRWTAVWLLTALALLTFGLYAWVGEPLALDHAVEPVAQHAALPDGEAPGAAPDGQARGPDQAQAPGGMGQAQIEAMVSRLAQRLDQQPDDPAGWRMLAKSYETLGRFPLAVKAYQQLLKLQKPDADVLTDYAVTLGMSLNQTLVGEPEALINQALALNPRHVQALALSGSAAFEKRDYAAAIAPWQKILTLLPEHDDMRHSIEANIAKAQSLAERDAAAAKGKGAAR
jgi:cytochrome c-type biogenesis protein CcmH/NrfG